VRAISEAQRRRSRHSERWSLLPAATGGAVLTSIEWRWMAQCCPNCSSQRLDSPPPPAPAAAPPELSSSTPSLPPSLPASPPPVASCCSCASAALPAAATAASECEARVIAPPPPPPSPPPPSAPPCSAPAGEGAAVGAPSSRGSCGGSPSAPPPLAEAAPSEPSEASRLTPELQATRAAVSVRWSGDSSLSPGGPHALLLAQQPLPLCRPERGLLVHL
jgi:hypothetical protein